MKVFYALGLAIPPEQEPRKSVRYIKNSVVWLIYMIILTLIGYAAHLINNTESATLKIANLIVSAIAFVYGMAGCISNVRKECTKNSN